MRKVTYDSPETFKLHHCNHKCIECANRLIDAYEDDSIEGRTPYHWWEGTCYELGIKISDDELPPDLCPFESKPRSFLDALRAMATPA